MITIPYQDLRVMTDATHDVSKNKGPMTLITDRSTKPDGFPFALKWDPSSSPSEVPIGMHHLEITMTLSTYYWTLNPIPCGMIVSNTMTLVTDRSTNPKGFAFALCFNPSAWVVTGPTVPTGGLFVTEIPLAMHHLGTDNSEKWTST